MHSHTLEQWQHRHEFSDESMMVEKRTTRVMLLTAVMMIAEIAAGAVFGSMALLADGWHMATHVAAFSITLFAYRYARRHAANPRYSYGTGKVGVLGGFASAVALAVVALVMALESVLRMLQPHAIHFNEAIVVAVLGLAVNLLCGYLLADHHHHAHQNAGEKGAHTHHDHNLRAAYFHVLADALTSVFAIVALLSGKYFGWLWLDPVMGLVGAAVITRWSYTLLRETGHILLDGSADAQTREAIRLAIEADADNQIADLHVWHLSPRHYAASICVVSHMPRAPDHYKQLLCEVPHLAHVVIEVNRCPGQACG